MLITTTRSGLSAIRFDTSAEAGRGMPKARSVLTMPKVRPRVTPPFSPNASVPMMTGICRIVTLIKPSGMRPNGVNPRRMTRAINMAVSVS